MSFSPRFQGLSYNEFYAAQAVLDYLYLLLLIFYTGGNRLHGKGSLSVTVRGLCQSDPASPIFPNHSDEERISKVCSSLCDESWHKTEHRRQDKLTALSGLACICFGVEFLLILGSGSRMRRRLLQCMCNARAIGPHGIAENHLVCLTRL